LAQIEWTKQVREALKEMSEKSSEGGNNAMRKVKKTWQNRTNLLVECVEKQGISNRDRNKIISLIIIEEHNRQVIESISVNRACNYPGHFDWQSQLRFEKSESIESTPDQMIIIVRQLNWWTYYGYEYQGNNGRLVITPLTDRAYMTLTNALNRSYGGAP
jgi:dynein heavy chain